MSSMLGGEVDLFGLDEFGNNPGMSEVTGVAIGVGASVLGKFAAQRMSGWAAANADLVGFATGGLASGIMYSLGKPSRAASIAAATAVGVFTIGNWLLNKAMPLSGMGLPQVEYLNGAMGLPQVEYLNGLGMPGIAPVPPSYGTIPGVYGTGFSGVAGPQLSAAQPPVDLLGDHTPRAQQAEFLGAPTLSGLASAYGATLLGR
jgi:hypothetical protein